MPNSPSTVFVGLPNCKRVFDTMHERSLAFRSAANGSVSESLRPLANRVVRRVHDHSDFQALFLRVALEASRKVAGLAESAPPLPLASVDDLERRLADLRSIPGLVDRLVWEIHLELIESPAFSTLVLEAIRDSKTWADLFSRDNGLKDCLKSLTEKLLPKDHATARTATALLSGSMGLLFAGKLILTIVPNLVKKDLSLPIHATLDNPQMELKLTPSNNPMSTQMKVTLVPDPKNPAFPLKLKAPESVDVSFQPKGKVKVQTEFVPSDSTVNVKGSGAAANCCCCGGKDASAELATLTSQLASLKEALGQNQSQDASIAEDSKKLSQKISDAQAQFEVADLDFSNLLATTSLTTPETTPENGGGEIFLQWRGAEGQNKFCKPTVHVKRENSSYKVYLSYDQCFDPKLLNDKKTSGVWNISGIQLHVNEPVDLYPVPYHLVISEAVHSLFRGRSHVTFRFQPNARHSIKENIVTNNEKTAKLETKERLSPMN